MTNIGSPVRRPLFPRVRTRPSLLTTPFSSPEMARASLFTRHMRRAPLPPSTFPPSLLPRNTTFTYLLPSQHLDMYAMGCRCRWDARRRIYQRRRPRHPCAKRYASRLRHLRYHRPNEIRHSPTLNCPLTAATTRTRHDLNFIVFLTFQFFFGFVTL